ncbi:MAG: protein kinase, partial [Chloroflexi bacterium]|nr:protein kinase [Chloroflexota bacterium]
MHELSGRFLGRGELRLVARLGAGAMGVVYEAEQPRLQRRVAVKVLWPHLTQEPGLVERFNREARIAARLDHAHVLPVYGFGEEDGLLYLVIRLVRGGSLKDRLRAEGKRRAGWTGSEALELARQALPALDYAHRRGVIHRDLKPDNILLEPSDDFAAGYRAFLSDFGIAQLAQAEDTELALTVTGAPPGTPAYMAPEQVLDHPLDGRADLYAFGVVLFELLAGRLPFQGQTPLATALQQVQQPLPSARGFNPRLSAGVEEVLDRALAKDPGQRFPNGAALLAALAAAVETPTSGPPPAADRWAPLRSAPDRRAERGAPGGRRSRVAQPGPAGAPGAESSAQPPTGPSAGQRRTPPRPSTSQPQPQPAVDVDAPMVRQPETQEPAVGQPIADERGVGKPAADEDVVGQARTEEPPAAQPVADEPAVGQPRTEEPTVGQPVAEEGVVGQPGGSEAEAAGDQTGRAERAVVGRTGSHAAELAEAAGRRQDVETPSAPTGQAAGPSVPSSNAPPLLSTPGAETARSAPLMPAPPAGSAELRRDQPGPQSSGVRGADSSAPPRAEAAHPAASRSDTRRVERRTRAPLSGSSAASSRGRAAGLTL